MANPEIPARFFLNFPDAMQKPLELNFRKVLFRFIGHAEVGEYPFRVQMGQVHSLRSLVRCPGAGDGKAGASHAGFQFDMNSQGQTGSHQRHVHFIGQTIAAHRLTHIAQPGNVRSKFRRRGAQNQNLRPNSCVPQFFCLVIASHRQIGHAHLLQTAADLHVTVAVGIGLYHAQIPAARRQLCPDLLYIMSQILQMNLRPGPFHFRIHLYSTFLM